MQSRVHINRKIISNSSCPGTFKKKCPNDIVFRNLPRRDNDRLRRALEPCPSLGPSLPDPGELRPEVRRLCSSSERCSSLGSGAPAPLQAGRQVLPIHSPNPHDIMCLGPSRSIKAAGREPGGQRTDLLAGRPGCTHAVPGLASSLFRAAPGEA